ncbi:MAG: hypothetical protein ABIF18_00505 [archaeon]
MSYKRVVKKGGKVYGPYVYESYRDEDGNVKKRYLGKPEDKKKSTHPFIFLVGILTLFLIVGISYSTDFLFNDAEISGNIFDSVKEFFIGTYNGLTGLIITEEDVAEQVEEEQVESSQDDSGDSEEIIEEEVEEVEAIEDIEEAIEEEAEVVEDTEEVSDEETEVAEEVEEAVEDEVEAETGGDEGIEMAEDVVENETLVDINETIVEINETLVNETFIEINETLINETLVNETLINETIIEINETLVNETIIEINETLVNETLVNETIINETVVVEVVENLTTLQYRAMIGKPVKWLKKLNVSEAESLSIEIPKLAENVSVLVDEEVGDAEREIEEYDVLVDEADKEEIVSGVLTGYVAMDIDSGRGIFTKFWNWILDFRVSGNVVLEEKLELEGEISETAESKIVDVERIVNETNAENVAVEYYTPAPIAVESNFSGGKLVTVSAEDIYNYTDVLAYSLIGEMNVPVEDSSKLSVYWRASYEDAVRYGYIEEDEELGKEKKEKDSEKPEEEETFLVDENETSVDANFSEEDLVEVNDTKKDKKDKNKTSLITGDVVADLIDDDFVSVPDYVRVAVNFSVHDFDEDGFIDYIEWIVPHLSNQTYEISITILNVQSYPTVGGNWTVGFNTTGEANLTISAFNETSYGFEQENSSVDLEFLELKCGEEIQNVSVLINGTAVPYNVYLMKKRVEEIRRELDG